MSGCDENQRISGLIGRVGEQETRNSSGHQFLEHRLSIECCFGKFVQYTQTGEEERWTPQTLLHQEQHPAGIQDYEAGQDF